MTDNCRRDSCRRNRLIFWASMIFVVLVIVAGLIAGAFVEQRPTLARMAGSPPAPDFVLPGPDGNEVSLKGLRGKVVIVNFWATWCPPCRAEMPSLQRAWEAIRDKGGYVLAIHVGGTMDDIWDFTGRYGLDFPIVRDAGSKVTDRWPVQGLPTTLVVDPQGRIAYRAIGGREWDDPARLKAVLDLLN